MKWRLAVDWLVKVFLHMGHTRLLSMSLPNITDPWLCRCMLVGAVFNEGCQQGCLIRLVHLYVHILNTLNWLLNEKKWNWEKCVQNNPKLILQFLKNKITTRIAFYTKSPTKSTTFSRRPRIKSDCCSDFIFQNKRSHFAFFTLFLKFAC